KLEKGKMRADAVKAEAAIDKLVADARLKVKKADHGSATAIADAGKEGKQAVTDMGPQALAEVVDADKKNGDEALEASAAERAKLDKAATDDQAGLGRDAGKAGAAIDDKLVKDAVAHAKGDLTRKHWYSYISDDEATRAMDAMSSLPKGLRGEAVK